MTQTTIAETNNTKTVQMSRAVKIDCCAREEERKVLELGFI
jgi:hypothetical protein